MRVLGAWLRAIALSLVTVAAASPGNRDRALRFEENRGQVDGEAAFLARGPGFVVHLDSSEAVLRLDGSSRCASSPTPDSLDPIVRLQFGGASTDSLLVPEGPLRGRTNYVRGSDPSGWLSGVPGYERIVNRDIYPGIDLVYYSREGALAFDLRVSPQADTTEVDLVFAGADVVDIDAEGELRVRLGAQSLRVGRPFVYQELEGRRAPVPAEFVTTGPNRVGFQIGEYDRSRLLTIDPVLSYCTYLGAGGDEFGRAVAVDDDGFVYVTGSTASLGSSEPDAFVTKLDPHRSEIVYTTYLGGGAPDMGRGIFVDGHGSVYVVGETYSADFPLSNPLQSAFGGVADAFVAKLDPSGETLEYSTFLGGSDFESARGVGVDSSGEVALMGQTLSADMPVANAVQPTIGGSVDAFVAKLDASGSELVFATFLGGSGDDLPFHLPGCGVPGDAPGWDVAVGRDGSVYVAGTTESLDFPVVGALQATHGLGLRDGFVAKFSPDGSALRYSTFLGGSGGDTARGIAVDSFGRVSVTGATRSFDFPLTPDALQDVKSGIYDAFLVELDAAGSKLLYSTYLGGEQSDAGNDIALDRFGHAVVVGQTLSEDFPVLDAFQSSHGGGLDLFAARFSPGGSLVYSSFLGGTMMETTCGVNMGVAVDPTGTAYVTGATESDDFPVTAQAVQDVIGGGFDAFVAGVRVGPEILVAVTPEGNTNRLKVTLFNHGSDEATQEIKFWVEIDNQPEISLVPVPFSMAFPTGATPLFDVLLPDSVSFPGATFGARLIEPETGLALSESICSTSPCH